MTIIRLYLPLFILALTGTTVPRPLRAQEPPPARGTDSVSFDYQDADLRFVVAALAQAAGLNIVFSALPSTPVTLRTNQPVNRAEIRALLISIVEANGLTVTEEGSVLRIEPAAVIDAQIAGDASPQDVRLFVYRMKHAQAGRMAGTIQALFGGGNTDASLSRSLSRTGLSNELRQYQIPPVRPDEPDAAVTPQITTSVPAQVSGPFQIHADDLTNSLLVRSTEADWPVILEAIQALDLRPLQVVIEVLIAEVRRTSNLTFGVGAEVPQTRDPDSGVVIGGELVGPSTGDFIVRLMEVGKVSADIVLTALSSRGDVNILSRPVILALNNQEARILIGSERPFVQVFRALPTDNAVRDQVVQYRDVGTSLTIRPTINHDGYVSLDLMQEVSTATNETQFGAPVISTRQAATQLLARNKQTVVIGGLVDRQNDRTRGGIPFLKDIPLIGALFGSTQRSTVHTELFLFVTPHIIASDEDADAIRESVKEETDLLRKLLPDRIPLLPDTVSK